MAQGQGGEELATPHSSNQGRPRGRGGAAVLIQLYVDERTNEVADRVARCQFDYVSGACATIALHPL